MPKNQVIYNQVGAYVGPAPSYNYHFISENGNLNNDFAAATGNYSLVFPLNRVIASSFSISSKRNQIVNLGNLGTISRPILESPDITLNVDYYLMGLVNEQRIGLTCNIPSGDPIIGPLLYGVSGRESILKGLYSRDTDLSYETEFGWPLKTREPKNFFFACRKDNIDLNDFTSGTNLSNSYKNTTVDVYGFGDCFLTSYRCSAAVGSFPSVSTSFTCNNLEVYSSGFGCSIPSIEPGRGNIRTGMKFSIPNNFQGSGLPTVLLPKDISISIKEHTLNTEDLNNLFLNYTDVKIQSFDFDFSLNRTPLYGLSYKYPLDRKITWPVISNLSFSMLPGDNKASSLTTLLKEDKEYDISIKLNYQNNNTSFKGTAIDYQFIGAKFENYSSSLSISDREKVSLSFTTEIDPENTNRGLFISGYLSIPSYPTDVSYLLGDFDYDGQQDDRLLFQNFIDLFALSISGFKILY